MAYKEDVELIEELTRLHGRSPEVLNVASGSEKKQAGIINCDIVPRDGVDVVADLESFPWPFEDNRFDVILCNHYIEHVMNVNKTMEEIHRVGKPHCTVVIRTPYYANYESFRDPTHRWHLTWESFDYFTGGFGSGDYKRKRRYILVKKRLSFAEHWRNPGYFVFRINSRFYEKYLSHLFPGTWLYVHLEVDKAEK